MNLLPDSKRARKKNWEMVCDVVALREERNPSLISEPVRKLVSIIPTFLPANPVSRLGVVVRRW